MKRIWLLPLLLLVLSLSACGGEEESTATPAAPTVVAVEATPIIEIGLAAVDAVSVDTVTATTVEVSVSGNLPDGCTVLGETLIQNSGSDFLVNLRTEREEGAVCTQALVPYTETVTLDAAGLAPGDYRVDVNGVSAAFRFGPEPTPTPEPTPVTGSGVISGRVVHDLCAVAGGEGGEAAVPSDGCVTTADGGFAADGVLDAEEPGLAGIEVNLGSGACPATGLASAITAEDGSFAFEELPAGAYCVSVDVGDAGNGEILIPGLWTTPDVGDGALASATITLFADETVENVDFGWDYQFLPEPGPVVVTDDCTNAILFVADISIPDDTPLSPGEAFVKTWQLYNNGTCDWTTDYALTFVDGERMTNDTSFPLPILVPAGEFIELSITMIAPLELGTYRSDWQIAAADGTLFGVVTADETDADSFWVQIVVEEGAAQPSPNSSVISGTVWLDDDGDAFYDSFEDPLEGVEVRLSSGVCPASGIVSSGSVQATTLTDVDGVYSFESLAGGSYCVSIAAFSAANVELLIPGDWTYPAQGVGLVTIFLIEGQQRGLVDFGWQYD